MNKELRLNGVSYAGGKNRHAKSFAQSVVEIGQAALYLDISVTEIKQALHSKNKLLRDVDAPKPSALSTRGHLYFEVSELDAFKDRIKNSI